MKSEEDFIYYITSSLTLLFMMTILFGVVTSTFEIGRLGQILPDPFPVFIGLLVLFALFMTSAFILTWERRAEITTKSRPTGPLDIEGLSNSPERFFRDEIWENLPQKPKQDIQEALISLDSGAPTASVLMGVKATEYALVEWYELETGRKGEAVQWFEIIRWLERDPNFTDDESIINRVNRLRKLRNQAAHPREQITVEEAQEILLDVREIISFVYSRVDSVQTRLSDFKE